MWVINKTTLYTILFSTICWATFSIVAIDPETGEVGSAGGSCIAGSIIISDIHISQGVIHTQSYYHPTNQNNASNYMNQGYSPQEIIDYLVENDVANNPGIRQYGVVDLENNGRSASFTGEACSDWKGHLNGVTYAIQGNILLGPEVLDQMEENFLNTNGPLSHKLMAALQGAKIPGADTRCLDEGISTLSSFIRVAQPENSPNDLYLHLNVNSVTAHYAQTGEWLDPIDSLQTLYDGWVQNQINGELGDVNTDSIIDILDVVNMVNFIMGNSQPTFEQQYLGDLNQDGIINIQDIILIINIILTP
jgi:uncharacterized Ntn-hydrolase superfamily protein